MTQKKTQIFKSDPDPSKLKHMAGQVLLLVKV